MFADLCCCCELPYCRRRRRRFWVDTYAGLGRYFRVGLDEAGSAGRRRGLVRPTPPFWPVEKLRTIPLADARLDRVWNRN